LEAGVTDEGPGKGFPPGFEYRWATGKNKNAIVCSGTQYMTYVLNWIEQEINNEAVFPTSSGNDLRFFSFLLKVQFTDFLSNDAFCRYTIPFNVRE
jgi:hypothetical protein